MQDTLKSVPARLKAAWRFLATKAPLVLPAMLQARRHFRSSTRHVITPKVAGVVLYAALVAAVAAFCVATLGFLGVLANAGLFPVLVLLLPGIAVMVLSVEVAQIAYRTGSAE
jgi:hypothetical protein